MTGFAAGRAAILALGFASLVAGILGGLVRLGVVLPFGVAGAFTHHGALMVGGFFGTLISLERAVAFGRREAYAAPLCAGIGAALLLWLPAPGAWLVLAGSIALVAVSSSIYAKQRALFTATLALGSACWVIGNAVWLAGQPVARAAPWWLGFFLITIAGERLELTRMLPRRAGANSLFGAVVLLLLFGMGTASGMPPGGWLAFAAGVAALALWLAWFDIARHTVLRSGLARYIAANLLAGYAWLFIAAAIVLLHGGLPPSGSVYDAAVHALVIGFVFSMVFGHAPVIFPAVLRVKMSYTPWFYLAPVLLHASLALRACGDLLPSAGARLGGAYGNAAAIAVFILVTAAGVLRAR